MGEAEGDVLVDAPVGKQSLVLKDQADATLFGRHGGDIAAIEYDAAGSNRI